MALVEAWGRYSELLWEGFGVRQRVACHVTLKKDPSLSFNFLMSKIRAIIQPLGL